MEQIKFRVWDTGSDRMVEWKDVQHWSFGTVDWEQYKFLQFTGLKDKNGKEIYEGDIVKCDDITCSVTWKDAAFHIITNESQGASVFVQDRARRFEVIGNIYEHPHLLTP